MKLHVLQVMDTLHFYQEEQSLPKLTHSLWMLSKLNPFFALKITKVFWFLLILQLAKLLLLSKYTCLQILFFII